MCILNADVFLVKFVGFIDRLSFNASLAIVAKLANPVVSVSTPHLSHVQSFCMDLTTVIAEITNSFFVLIGTHNSLSV